MFGRMRRLGDLWRGSMVAAPSPVPPEPPPEPPPSFREELERLINAHSRENGCNTPDWVLAQFLHDSLDAFDRAVNAREKWYGRKNKGPCGEEDDGDEG